MRGALFLCSLLVGATACGASNTAPPPSAPPSSSPPIAVLPAVWVTPDPSSTEALTGAAVEGLRQTPGVRAERVRVPVRQHDDSACHDDIACMRAASRKAKAARVLVTKLAGLGDTVLVRMSLFDVSGGTNEQTRQSVVRTSDDASIRAAVRTLAHEMGKPFGKPRSPEPPEESWYEQWWVWAGAGAIVSAGVAVPLMMREDPAQDPNPDVIITPP